MASDSNKRTGNHLLKKKLVYIFHTFFYQMDRALYKLSQLIHFDIVYNHRLGEVGCAIRISGPVTTNCQIKY